MKAMSLLVFAVLLLSAPDLRLEAQGAAAISSSIKVKVAFAESESFISSSRVIEDFEGAAPWSAISASPDVARAEVAIRSVDFIPAVGTIEGTNRILGLKAAFRKNGEAELTFRPPRPLPLGLIPDTGKAAIRCMFWANNGLSRLLVRISDGKGQSWLAGQTFGWSGWKACSFPLQDLPASMAGRPLFVDALLVDLHPADYSAAPVYWYVDNLSVVDDSAKTISRPIVPTDRMAEDVNAVEFMKSIVVDPVDQSTFPHWIATGGAGRSLSTYITGEQRPRTPQGEVAPDNRFIRLSFGSQVREKDGYRGVKVWRETPLLLPGITKTIAVWLRTGSNGIKAYYVVRDLRGFDYELLAGIIPSSEEMKKLIVAVPPRLLQKSWSISDRIGLSFIGFDFVPFSGASGSIDIDLVDVATDTFVLAKEPDSVEGGW